MANEGHRQSQMNTYGVISYGGTMSSPYSQTTPRQLDLNSESPKEGKRIKTGAAIRWPLIKVCSGHRGISPTDQVRQQSHCRRPPPGGSPFSRGAVADLSLVEESSVGGPSQICIRVRSFSSLPYIRTPRCGTVRSSRPACCIFQQGMALGSLGRVYSRGDPR